MHRYLLKINTSLWKTEEVKSVFKSHLGTETLVNPGLKVTLTRVNPGSESVPHVALQVSHCPRELRLCGLGQLRVKAAAGAPPAVLLVFVLEHRLTKVFSDSGRVIAQLIQCDVCVAYIALQLGDFGGKLRLRRLRQLRVNAGRLELLPFFISDLLRRNRR